MSGAGARFELDHRIHVLTRKEELDEVRVVGEEKDLSAFGQCA